MLIRKLDPGTDRALVEGFFAASADYVRLERDAEPTPELAQDFVTDAPPGADPATSHRVGLFGDDPNGDGPNGDTLFGSAELSFGYPDAPAAWIGLMLIVSQARGQGAGQTLLRHLETTARTRGASRLDLGMLTANPRGRAFWYRAGFAVALANRPGTLGSKTRLAHRLATPL